MYYNKTLLLETEVGALSGPSGFTATSEQSAPTANVRRWRLVSASYSTLVLSVMCAFY